MKQQVTKGIILSRTDYGEADRIITLLTPDHGKLRLIARGVRKVKSKLAGGIELFSISDITFIQGRGDIGTLVSARLERHYGNIVKHLERVQLGYYLIKSLNKATEDQPEEAYFALLQGGFAALDDASIDLQLIRTWFEAQLLRQAGHAPNLQTDTAGLKLAADHAYMFDFEAVTFTPRDDAPFTAAHIKALRLLFAGHPPDAISRVEGLQAVLPEVARLTHAVMTTHIRT